MDFGRIKESIQGILTDYRIIKNHELTNTDHRDTLINSLALRILGVTLMVTAALLILTGVGLISLASLGSLPTLIIAVASGIFGHDCLIIGDNQSKLIAQVVKSQKAAATTTLWQAFQGMFIPHTPAATTAAAPKAALKGERADLEGTIAVKPLYNFLTKPS